MDYIITDMIKGKIYNEEKYLPISESEYNQIKGAYEALQNARFIEEEYEVLLSNYIELEKVLSNYLISVIVRRFSEDFYDLSFNFRLEVNISLSSLLSAVELYTHRLPSRVRKSSAKGKMLQKRIQEEKEENRRTCFEYLFMDELRNHAQHYGLPTHHLLTNSSWKEDGREFTADYFATQEWLKKDEELWRNLESELRKKGEKIDLKACVRVYVERLSHIHDSARSMIQEHVNASSEKIRKILADYEQQVKPVSPNACKMDGDQVEERIPLWMGENSNWDIIQRLWKRNKTPLNKLQNRYISGRIS